MYCEGWMTGRVVFKGEARDIEKAEFSCSYRLGVAKNPQKKSQ